ncbi:MAG: hypothetical protein ACTHKC_10530, partial [Candidatus Nitrosocosmicus sp.]
STNSNNHQLTERLIINFFIIPEDKKILLLHTDFIDLYFLANFYPNSQVYFFVDENCSFKSLIPLSFSGVPFDYRFLGCFLEQINSIVFCI